MVTLQQKYGCEIKFRATMVWIGVAPKLDLDCDQYPCKQVTPWMISPFLHKRGLDEEIFARLVKGEMPPKEYVVPSENSEKDPLPPNRVPGHVVQLKKPDHGSMGGTQCGIMSIDGGPYSGEKAFFSRTCVYIYGYRMTKADLMHVIKGTDKFNIEVQGGTNNKSVPYSVTSAWIGPQPNDKGKDCPQDMMNKDFCVWLQNHDFKTLAAFERVVSGEEKPKPFFPIAQETQIGRIMHLYPCVKNKVGEGVDCGIIKIQQGSLAKKDVLFERESIYLWGVNFRGGDITYFLKEGTKVMVEVSEIIGKDRKKWQTKLGSQSIPKYTATIVYVGGGRPKESANKVFSLNELNENTNLKQWLNKRGRDMTFFHSLLCGKVMPYRPPEPPQLIPGGSIWERRQPAQGNNAQVSMQYHNNKESSPGYEGAGFPMASPHHSSSHPPPPPFHDPSSRKGSLTEQQQPPFLSKDSPWSSSRSNLSYAQQQQQSMQNVPDPQQSNHHSRHHPPPHLLSPPYSHANNHSSHNHHAPLPHHLAQGPPAGSKSPWSPERNPSPTRFDDDQSVSSRDSCPLVIQNPIMKQAERMLSKVMACSSLEDPKVSSVIDSETDYQLANFISKTLETCLRQYRHKHHQQDPIGPPKRSNFPAQSSSDLESRHGGNGGLPAPLPSSSVASVRDGLYGLQEPLLGQSSLGNIGRAASGPVSRNSSSLFSPGLGPASPWMPEDNPNSSFESENRVRRPLRRESPVEFNYGSELFEPPYKRKHPTEPGNNSCANNSHHQQMF